MMNYDTKSSSPSTPDDDHPAQDEATTTDRRTPVNTLPTEPDEGAAANDWCAWCGRGPPTDEEDFDLDETWPPTGDDHDQRRPTAYDQLRFCSRSCLSRYKMDLFCRETQRYLQQLQGSDRLTSGTGSDDKKEPRILITPELWSQPEPDNYQAVRIDPEPAWKDGGTTRRRRSNGDGTEAPSAARQKVRKINVADRLAASRRPGRHSTSDGVQPTYLRGSVSRTSSHRDSMTTGGSVKSESDDTDHVMGGGRPEELANVSLPWIPATSAAPVHTSLPSPFPRGFFASPLWSHSPPGFPPSQVRPPPFAAATSIPLAFGGAGWPPAGLVQPTTMFVPYPIPVPLPLPLPIPIPVPMSKLPVADTSRDVCSTGDERHEDSNREPKGTDCLPGKSVSSDRPCDRRTTSSLSPTAKSVSASSSPTASSSDAWNVLDLSTGGRSTDSSSANVVRTNAATTVDASPYLARRSLILDAPAVDRKCFGDQTQPVGGVRTSSLSVAGKRFNHHRRRTTPMPLVKSK